MDDLEEINLRAEKRTDGKYAKQMRLGSSVNLSRLLKKKPKWKRQLVAIRQHQRAKANRA